MTKKNNTFTDEDYKILKFELKQNQEVLALKLESIRSLDKQLDQFKQDIQGDFERLNLEF